MSLLGLRKLPTPMKHLAVMFCSCGTEENTWGKILAELELLERGERRSDDDLASAIVDYLRLSEHGGSIGGAWLTDAGKEALAFLREYGIDWRDKGLFVDDEGVHHGHPTLDKARR